MSQPSRVADPGLQYGAQGWSAEDIGLENTHGKITHAFERLDASPAAPALSVLRETQRILSNAVREVAVRLAAERSTPKNELICADAERPPVDRVGITTLREDFGSHVCHRTSYALQKSSF